MPGHRLRSYASHNPQDAYQIDPAHRPLIIAGGPHAVYEPYDLFSANPARPGSADVVVTGEEFVMLSLIEVLLSVSGRHEPMRLAFVRARDSGALDEVPGLVYSRGSCNGVPEELIDTGMQRLVGDLDELPHPGPRLPTTGAAKPARNPVHTRAAGRSGWKEEPDQLTCSDLQLQVQLSVLSYSGV